MLAECSSHHGSPRRLWLDDVWPPAKSHSALWLACNPEKHRQTSIIRIRIPNYYPADPERGTTSGISEAASGADELVLSRCTVGFVQTHAVGTSVFSVGVNKDGRRHHQPQLYASFWNLSQRSTSVHPEAAGALVRPIVGAAGVLEASPRPLGGLRVLVAHRQS